MLSHNYTYQDCLDNSKQVSWREEDILGARILTSRSVSCRIN